MIQQTFNPPAGDHLSPRRPANWATRIGPMIVTGVELSVSKDGGVTWEPVVLTPSEESLRDWFMPKVFEIPFVDQLGAICNFNNP